MLLVQSCILCAFRLTERLNMNNRECNKQSCDYLYHKTKNFDHISTVLELVRRDQTDCWTNHFIPSHARHNRKMFSSSQLSTVDENRDINHLRDISLTCQDTTSQTLSNILVYATFTFALFNRVYNCLLYCSCCSSSLAVGKFVGENIWNESFRR